MEGYFLSWNMPQEFWRHIRASLMLRTTHKRNGLCKKAKIYFRFIFFRFLHGNSIKSIDLNAFRGLNKLSSL